MNIYREFKEKGFTHLDQLLTFKEVQELRSLYIELLQDRQRTAGLRSDLAGGGTSTKVERITQVMRPSQVEPRLGVHPAYAKALQYAHALLGEDMALDFDMLINKAPYTYTETPWHQDAAYWIKMPDKRAVSCWIALDEVTVDNGCMWFIPHKGEEIIQPHERLPGGGALFCEPDTSDAQAIPLSPGGCTFHGGYTLHFSRGNSTARHRRALILNFRPQAMIDLERAQGVDHTGERKVRNGMGR